jgi:hypothetical protein
MRDYQKLAPLLNPLKPDPNATMHYDLFADALVWSDEIPSPADVKGDVLVGSELRGVWHFRTTLILAQPKEKFRPAWEEALRCFPNWPGFDPKRRDTALAAAFSAMREAAMKKWEEAEERINASLAEQTEKASA